MIKLYSKVHRMSYGKYSIITIADKNIAFVGISRGGFNFALQKFNVEPKVDTLRHRMIPVKYVIVIIKIRVKAME